MQTANDGDTTKDSKMFNSVFKRWVATLPRFRLRDLLLLVLYFPISVGVVMWCYWQAFYYDFVVLQQPLETIRRIVVHEFGANGSQAWKFIYGCLLYAITFLLAWATVGFVTGIYGWIRNSLARLYTKVFILSVAVVQFMLLPSMHEVPWPIYLGASMCVGLAPLPSLAVFALVCRFRPLRDNRVSASALHAGVGRIVLWAVVLGTIVLSASGWSATREVGIFAWK